MCRTKHGDKFYCECCERIEDSHHNRCLSNSGTKGLKLDSSSLSITKTDNNQQSLLQDGFFRENVNVSTALKSCEFDHNKEFVCTVYADTPEKTHCVCTDFSDDKDKEYHVFNTHEVWDPWKLQSIAERDKKFSMLGISYLLMAMFVVLTLAVIAFFFFVFVENRKLKRIVRKYFFRIKENDEKEKVLWMKLILIIQFFLQLIHYERLFLRLILHTWEKLINLKMMNICPINLLQFIIEREGGLLHGLIYWPVVFDVWKKICFQTWILFSLVNFVLVVYVDDFLQYVP